MHVRRIGFGLRPRRVITRRVIRDSSRASTENNSIPRLSQPGPYTRRLIAHRAICDYISSMRVQYVDENSSADSSIDEKTYRLLGNVVHLSTKSPPTILQLMRMTYRRSGTVTWLIQIQIQIQTRIHHCHRLIDGWPVNTDGMKAPQNLLMTPLFPLLNTTVRIRLKLKRVTLFLWLEELLLVLSPRGSLKMRFHIMRRPVSLRVPRAIRPSQAQTAVHTVCVETMVCLLNSSISGTSPCLMNNCWTTC